MSEALSLGVYLRNIVPAEISWKVKGIWERDSSKDEKLPLAPSFGFQYILLNGRLGMFGDVSKDHAGDFRINCGSDFQMNRSFSLRAGVRDVTEDRNLSFGGTFGLPEPFESFDIGYAFFGDAIDAGYAHEISLSFSP